MSAKTTTNFCIVTKSGSGPMALVRQIDALALPVVSLSNETWPADQAAEVNGQLMDRHGLNCTMLRWLENWRDSNLLVMEWHPGSPVPEVDVVWVDPSRNDLPLPQEQLQMVRKWRQSPDDGLVPWEKPGWMKEVVLWLLKRFDGIHHPQLTNLAQIKAGWGMSMVLLVETTEADYFFKAGTRQGIDEWRLVKLLHARFPELVPAPNFVDEQRGWMVTRKVENSPNAPLDYDGLGMAFRAYARIQLGCADLLDNYLAPGLRVRDASWLRSHVDAFFSMDGIPEEFSILKAQLKPLELTQLEKAWRQNIETIETTELPLTLNQEDLHFENILNTDHGPILIDWADCALAHPFFSFHRINSLWSSDFLERDRLERAHVQQAYLDSFRHLADENQLRREIELTDRLTMLYHAFRWHEMAQSQQSDSYWSKRCRENAVRRMKDALERASA